MRSFRQSHAINNNYYNIQSLLRNRELGTLRRQFGIEDYIAAKLYVSLDKCEKPRKYDSSTCENQRKYGGIFNLEFSLDGKLLVAACEEKSILLYDAANQKCLNTVTEAHSNCVNCIRFLNSYTFATCSDDTSIKLWDLRNLRKETRSLYGHQNWVKNVEFSESENVIVTSAFDGSIYTWDLKGDNESNQPYNAVFIMNGIMRTKLSPDGTKMLISTTGGYMIIIHNLNLATLAKDLKNFKPNIYRLMQLTAQNFPVGSVYSYLFHPERKRNRLEFIDDFPNKADVISSLQIHPHGWSALSRNINAEENEDWTSVHDIQPRDSSEHENTYVDEDNFKSDDEAVYSNHKPTDLWIGYTTNEMFIERSSGSSSIDTDGLPPIRSINSGLLGRNAYKSFLEQHPEYQTRIVKNIRRLTHFIEEKIAGKGYIKEVCFSPDGRIICSPYDKGIRLLGFNEKAQELTHCLPDSPKELVKLVEMSNYHKNVVVCCKFNPVHMQLVSGCLGGDIVWYEPFI